MKSYIRKVTCWACGTELDMATGVLEAEGKKPKDNDVSFCIRCGEWGVFDTSHVTGQRKPTEAEYDEIGTDPQCRKVRSAWMMMASTASFRHAMRNRK